MAKKPGSRELDVGRLTSVDESGRRLGIIPAEVKGYWRRHRVWFHWLLLVIFLAVPWTRVNGLQTILLNVPDREFILLGVVFRAHDVPLLFFILALAAIGLAFVTSIWGRVWCGWACPQTVFVETVYRGLERWSLGNYIERRKLRDAPWSFFKLRKLALKWGLFLFVSALISHSFIAYFVGAEELISMIQKPPRENFGYFLLVMGFTGLTAFDFGWFREQFCVIMCPYGRFQSVLLDKRSLAVVYDNSRGEPRKGIASAGEKAGDCVACNRCVEVCPTGIDIRNGLQMECIACTACIDACDEIMEKVKRPKGLIRYDTLDGRKISLKNPRALFYMAMIVALTAGLLYSLYNRQSFHLTLLRGKGDPYSQVLNTRGESVLLNQFHFHLQNQSFQSATYTMSLTEDMPAELELTVGEPAVSLKPGTSRDWFFFVRFPKDITLQSGKYTARVRVTESYSNGTLGSEQIIEVPLVGPREQVPSL